MQSNITIVEFCKAFYRMHYIVLAFLLTNGDVMQFVFIILFPLGPEKGAVDVNSPATTDLVKSIRSCFRLNLAKANTL